MFKVLNALMKTRHRTVPQQLKQLSQYRTFLSQAYYCNEVWEQRFADPVLQKINLDELYNELDQGYQRTRNISAVDVDVFANAVKEEAYVDELLDLVHKLRMSADTSNTLNSTSHAVVRNLTAFGRTDQLLSALDDRLNYGLFLDDFTASILLDLFWKNKDYASGARVASQLMLQEEFAHPLCANLSLLHCYAFLLAPSEWPQPAKPEEPEEEVKVRINYLRNPYDDEHFDLRDPHKIVGKTLAMITKGLQDTLEKSLHLLGLALFERHDEAKQFIARLAKSGDKVYQAALDLIPEDNATKAEAKVLQMEKEQVDLQELLQARAKASEQAMSEKDVALQCETYSKWEQERKEALQRQQERLQTARRLTNIEELRSSLQDKEMLLWFFENKEQIELEIEEKQASLAESREKRRVVAATEEKYVPPEVQKKFNS